MKLKSKITLSVLLMSILLHSCTMNSTNKNKASGIKGIKHYADFPVGSAIIINKTLRDKKLKRLQIQNFNSITSTSDMKMYNIARKSGEYNFKEADMLLEYAIENNQRLFGHNLIWHSSTPPWVSELAEDPEALDDFMKEYIHTYVGRYKGKVHGWDVVNEGMNTFGGGYRETVWYKALGKDYIAKAFTYAHEADPDAILFYNDFNIERDTAKLNSVIQMIEELKAAGIPISGLGFQMHIRMDIPDEIIASSLKKGVETGLQIHLSEVDIIFNTHNDSPGSGIQLYNELTDDMREQQAEKYKNLAYMYKTIVPKAQQYGITFWEFNDRDSWIKRFFNLKDWPCLFDENLEPKPAYKAFIEGLTKE